jgi:hypothetical protein
LARNAATRMSNQYPVGDNPVAACVRRVGPRSLRIREGGVDPSPDDFAGIAKYNKPGTNKKAEVSAMMKRAKGTTFAEIVEATGWQKHTIRGFVSILGGNGGEKIESAKNAAGESTYRIAN